ncbi:VOC family protein [Erythrobacter dokdonensis]|uniref:Glyoxalase family protein n=1 Tax=Erythrobacter dokdonensis DSW-74 TaxID=1300349 RepID=A0A1A7BFW3_9SPHN|nr:VOC family protein [Erythrobacter dokdonensis]OBV10297.1 Glyoxalase family protein [Erythrobacter dokdonensis DSW-74]
MKMHIKSVMVADQAKAHKFYTDVLGFKTKHNIEFGEHRWLTLVSPEEEDGVELALEPNVYPAARSLQDSLHKDGIPWTQFSVPNLAAEYERLAALGVEFRTPPTEAGGTRFATFDDTCGNLIQLIEVAD